MARFFAAARQLAQAAAAVRDLTYETKVYEFVVTPPVTFYLDVEAAAVQIAHWDPPKIRVTARLEAGFGWRVQGEQDAAGVYIAARRKTLVGQIASAQFAIWLPPTTHCILKLAQSQLTLQDVTTTLHLPPLNAP